LPGIHGVSASYVPGVGCAGEQDPLFSAGQVLAFHELHQDEITSLGAFQAVHRCDVRVLDGGQKAGFAAQSVDGLRILGQGAGQQLDGDASLQSRILGEINVAHAALTELLQDSIVSDGLVEHELSLSRWLPDG
jgi:hypothetical protein